jgi:predicted phosphoribosyltransferase
MKAVSPVCSEVEIASGNIYYCEDYSWRYHVFHDRVEAGVLLAKFIAQVASEPFDMVVGLVAGGVPVSYSVSKELGVPMDVVVVKKITYPWTTEAGFGAVAPDGLYEFNREAARHAGFSLGDVEREAGRVHQYVISRTLKLRDSLDYSNVKGRKVILVDDGIATGYTMIVAIKFLRRAGAPEVTVATPTASLDGALAVSKEAYKLLVLNLRTGPFYAVADAYREWHDVSDEEAKQYIEKAKEGTHNTYKPQTK